MASLCTPLKYGQLHDSDGVMAAVESVEGSWSIVYWKFLPGPSGLPRSMSECTSLSSPILSEYHLSYYMGQIINREYYGRPDTHCRRWRNTGGE